jgi:hypothetical protein
MRFYWPSSLVQDLQKFAIVVDVNGTDQVFSAVVDQAISAQRL